MANRLVSEVYNPVKLDCQSSIRCRYLDDGLVLHHNSFSGSLLCGTSTIAGDNSLGWSNKPTLNSASFERVLEAFLPSSVTTIYGGITGARSLMASSVLVVCLDRDLPLVWEGFVYWVVSIRSCGRCLCCLPIFRITGK